MKSRKWTLLTLGQDSLWLNLLRGNNTLKPLSMQESHWKSFPPQPPSLQVMGKTFNSQQPLHGCFCSSIQGKANVLNLSLDSISFCWGQNLSSHPSEPSPSALVIWKTTCVKSAAELNQHTQLTRLLWSRIPHKTSRSSPPSWMTWPMEIWFSCFRKHSFLHSISSSKSRHIFTCFILGPWLSRTDFCFSRSFYRWGKKE